MNVKEKQAGGMPLVEAIPYGSVSAYQGVASVSEFYGRLGLLARLEAGEISNVSQLRMSPADHEALEQMILGELKRKNRGYLVRAIRTAAMMDWLNLAPGQDEAVPRGELWIMKRQQNGRFYGRANDV